MRPKVVIFTVLVAFVALGMIAIFKGLNGIKTDAHAAQGSAMQTTSEKTVSTNDLPGTVGYGLNTGNLAVSDELRAAVIAKEVEQIQDLEGQVDGTNNVMIINALLAKMTNPEAEVRQAVLDALKRMNDTNSLPGLQKVAAAISDPRERVAVLDAIDYIKLPSATDNVPPELTTNIYFHSSTATNRHMGTNVHFNPNFLKGNKNMQIRDNGQQTYPPNAPAGQTQ